MAFFSRASDVWGKDAWLEIKIDMREESTCTYTYKVASRRQSSCRRTHLFHFTQEKYELMVRPHRKSSIDQNRWKKLMAHFCCFAAGCCSSVDLIKCKDNHLSRASASCDFFSSCFLKLNCPKNLNISFEVEHISQVKQRKKN